MDVLNASGEYPESSEVVIAVPSIYMESILATMRSDIAAAAQDVGISGNGAFTGETSAEMLLDLGVKWTLADHSERRAGYGGPGESSEQVAMKAKRAVDKGVNVIICVGEKLSDREVQTSTAMYATHASYILTTTTHLPTVHALRLATRWTC